jgi:O-antigen/teichoic acid export membrane protein
VHAPDGPAGAGPGPVGWHFASATLSKLTPPAVQLALLLVVGRQGSIEDVGLLALASAVAFTCGAIAEAGFNTSLSIPETYLHDELPPLRGTRRARIVAAIGGSALYAALWAAGLGKHEPVLLILLPLPALLALSYGYSGVMNSAGQLRLEARISVAESAFVLVLVAALSVALEPLETVLLALLGGRAAGTAARAAWVRSLPQSGARAVRDVGRTHAWFVASTASTAIHGQIDAAVLGFFGAFALLGVYGPLVRTAYSGLLVAEGLAWALYARTTHERVREARLRGERSLGDRLLGRWRTAGVGLGAVCAVGFWFLGAPVLEFVLDADVDGLRLPIALLSATILVRFGAFVLTVDIIRAGRQRARIPVELAAAVVLGSIAVAGALEESLSLLALGKLASEVVLAAGYLRIARAREPSAGLHERAVHA